MPSRIANVWAAPCEECGAQANAPCQDLRTGLRRQLFGRRTHRSRARAVKAMGSVANQPQDHLRPGGYIKPDMVATLTGPTGQYNPPTGGWINIMSTSNTSTITIRDNIWQGWVVGNTTGTSTFITDQQLMRFEGSGITWNQVQPYPYINVTQEQVAQRWHVLHENMVQASAAAGEAARRMADQAQTVREQLARERLARQQREEQLIEQRLMAHGRGLELLDMLLTEEQQEQRHTGQIRVTGSDGGRFVIDIGYRSVHGNVFEEDAHGCFLGRICVAPQMRVDGRALPLSDGWVGQLLAIQANEAEFRRVGNWSSVRRCQHPDVPILDRAA